MKTKVEGISILVSMGTSLIVLSLAFATLTSISRSIDQASNIQRSTQLFFASESGAEAAFFHNNARGAGLYFDGVDDPGSDPIEDLDEVATQIYHPSIDATTSWTIQGRTTHRDDAIGDNAIIVDILKEGQTYKIPLKWDPASNPVAPVPSTPSAYTSPGVNDELEFIFYQTPGDMDSSTALTEFQERYGFRSDAFDPLQGAFDFGDNGDEEILIDWSLTRKNNVQGVQTFIPTINQNCDGRDSDGNLIGYGGYVCEDDLAAGGVRISTAVGTEGKVLPGAIDSRINNFWDCTPGADDTVRIGETCSDYQLTIRPLLKFYDSSSGDKVPGIPFQIKLDTGNNPAVYFPRNYYTVVSDVTLEDFSQRIELEIPIRTSIGAFDYVIFD